LPSNSELGAILGMSGDSIRQREPWKNKDVIISDIDVTYDTYGF
jgi:hypothetical protein